MYLHLWPTFHAVLKSQSLSNHGGPTLSNVSMMLPMSILTFSLVVLIGRMPIVLPRQDGFEKDQ